MGRESRRRKELQENEHEDAIKSDADKKSPQRGEPRMKRCNTDVNPSISNDESPTKRESRRKKEGKEELEESLHENSIDKDNSVTTPGKRESKRKPLTECEGKRSPTKNDMRKKAENDSL